LIAEIGAIHQDFHRMHIPNSVLMQNRNIYEC
jgi:hypothetical protein